ncbi:MAG: ABC transporter ATP-binding protein, partial [Acidobacteriota bacterium]
EVRDSGLAKIFISSHLLRDVEECCEEVLVLKDGRIATYCNLEEERRANRKFLEIETQGDAADHQAEFSEELRNRGCEVAIQNRRRMKAVLPEGVEIRNIYESAAARDIQIRKLDYKRDSLEDIFLKAMEGDD